MFIEPIGSLVARTLWAEMLDDRKFYFPVVAKSQDTKPEKRDDSGPPARPLRKWRPVGDASAVTMNGLHPYVGAQDVQVALDTGQSRGIEQSGIGVAKGKAYTGHIIIRGTPGAAVEATLIWGDGANDRQVVRLPALTSEWQTVPLHYTPDADSNDARFEITGTGSGDFRVGVVSLMPADNIDGWRADTVAILKGLHSGFWRLPGGNFLSNWDWHEAIGPRDKRPPMFDHAWGAMQANDFGMDEWLELTKLIGVQPYITVNAGLGDANSAAEEVEYINGPASSYWGAKRATNGHPAPYGVKFWNIGNEPYGWWQIGKTTLDYFMLKHNRFAVAMRAVDPSITLIGSGAMPDQLHPRDAKENASLQSIQHKFGTDEDWTGGLLREAWGNFDGLSEHWYDHTEKRPDAPPAEALMEFVRSPSNQVRMKADEWKIYQQRFPKMKDKDIFLSIDEYAYIGAPQDLKLSLAYSMVLQEMLRHTDFLRMSAFTTGASTMDITPTASMLNSTGEVFKLYGEHFGAGMIPVDVTGNSPQPDPKYPVGYDHPKVKAGSPTYPLDMVAALSPDRKTLTIAVVNATEQAQPVAIRIDGARAHGRGTVWRLTGKSLTAANKVGSPSGVTIRKANVPALGSTLVVPAISTSIYEFPLVSGHQAN
ncbi:alpha-L-arabinofuranosidase C-terminal domain-containing protein [Stakelama sediminis]|nr:alpha-L-arabinofuranosidase C-terminal domain-containing protein [Stakelama sediminis]